MHYSSIYRINCALISADQFLGKCLVAAAAASDAGASSTYRTKRFGSCLDDGIRGAAVAAVVSEL
jgi:uridine phosphorylase